MEAYKRQKKKSDCIPEPNPPPIRLLFLPANSSSTPRYQVLNETDEQGLMNTRLDKVSQGRYPKR